MELPFHSYWIFLVRFIAAATAINEAKIVCDQTYYVEVGTQATVSCEYDQSFIAVRWYFDGADVTFLRIDGTSKSGSGIENGEYDIGDDGSMIIKNVGLKHEGRYNISVLHQSVTVSRKEIMVYAMVSLDEVEVTNCASSTSELCNAIPSEQRKRTLLCVAQGSRPPVEIEWKTSFQDENLKALLQDYHVHMDPSSSLYTSTSYLHYENNLFALGYFTCHVKGVAAKDVRNSSVLLEGNGEFLEHTEDIQHVEEGSSFHIQCPDHSFQFAMLKFTDSSDTEKLVMTSHPSNKDSQCSQSSRCEVGEDGLITIENVSLQDEGLYECAFGNGFDFYIHALKVIVVVFPSPAMTVIAGCEDTQRCKMNGSAFGTLKCSLFGSKPPTRLTYTISENSRSDITLFNIRNDIVNSERIGTFDSVLTADYEMKVCFNPVRIKCQADSEVYRGTTFSDLELTLAEEFCQEKSGSAIIVILVLTLFLVLVAAFAISFVVMKKRRDSRKNVSQKTVEEREQMVGLISSDKHPTKISDVHNKPQQTEIKKILNTDVKVLEAQGEPHETEPEDTLNTDEKDFEQEDKSRGRKAIEQPKTGSEISDVQNKPQGTKAQDTLHTDTKDFEQEDKLRGKEAIEQPKTESEISDVQSKPQGTKAHETLHTDKKDSFDLTYMEIEERHKDNKNKELEVANDILKHYLQNKIKLDKVFTYVSFSSLTDQDNKKITYVYFLQSSIHLYQGEEIDPKCHQTFNEILSKAMAQEISLSADEKLDLEILRKLKKTILQGLKSHPSDTQKREKKTDLARLLLKVLLYCEMEKMICQETCVNIVAEELEYKTLTQFELTTTLNHCLKEKMITKQSYITILQSLVQRNKMTSDHIKVALAANLKNNLIQQDAVIAVLHSFVVKNQMPAEKFTDVLQEILQTGKEAGDKFTDILYRSLSKGHIQTEVFITALQSLLARNQIKFPTYIDVLKRSLKDKLIEEALFEEHFSSHLKSDKWNFGKDNWIWVVSWLLDKGCITEELRINLFNMVVEKYQISEKQMKAMLQKMEVKEENRKEYVSGVKF